ncbi:hypothetical protein Tco_0510478 [Tanacetum coccineum]
MPPRRSSATARAAAAAARAAIANHETLSKVALNAYGERKPQFRPKIRGTERTPRVIIESVFHISNCPVENQVKFYTCTFLGNTLTWWNSHMKIVTLKSCLAEGTLGRAC